MSESHQPADDHAEQPQEAARHQKEVHHCQTRTCKQPSSPTQVKLKTTSCYFLFTVLLNCFIEFRLIVFKNANVKRIMLAALTVLMILHQMVLLRDASCRPGWGEASGSTQTSDRANGESEGGGGPQHGAPDVLPGGGGSRQEKNVYAPLQRGQC